MRDDEALERSSGNIFADLGLPDAEQALAKAQIVLQINSIVEQQGWTDDDASDILGIPVTDFVALSEGAALTALAYSDLAFLLERLKAAEGVASCQTPKRAEIAGASGYSLPLAATPGSDKPGGVSFD